MKQIWLELWVENTPHVLLIVKGLLILGLLFGGLLLQGYPYSMILLMCTFSLEVTGIKLESGMEYLIPRTHEDKKKLVIGKSVVMAGIYSLANVLGYVLTISFSGRYHWDAQLMVFIPVMGVIVFNMLLIMRVEMITGSRLQKMSKA